MTSIQSTNQIDRFYSECQHLAGRYADTVDERSKYMKYQPCDIIAAVCMDERERDFGETMGLPFGLPLLIETAGNKLGQINAQVDDLIVTSVKKAVLEQRRVLLLFVTHSSLGEAETDSCAAWSHNTRVAKKVAEEQVWRWNHLYSQTSIFGVPQPLIAMHLHSYTDTEAKCWLSGEFELDPMRHVESFAKLSYKQAEEEANELGFEKLALLYPYTDARFFGLDHKHWEMVIHQCAKMFAANMLVVRDVHLSKREASKKGHQARRILIGDWPLQTESGPYFKIGSYVPDLGTELGIAFKYVLRNEIRHAAGDIDYQPRVPIHVNVEHSETLNRLEAANRSRTIARLIRNELEDLLLNPHRQTRFTEQLLHVLEAGGINDDFFRVSGLLKNDPLSTFTVIPSVSNAQTKVVERLRAFQP